MKRTVFLLFYFYFFTFALYAQQPTEEWVRRFSDTSTSSWQGTSIKSDSLGYIYVLARTVNNFGFIKYDANGNLLATAAYWPGGFNNGGGGTYFDVTPAGEVYVTGGVELGFQGWIYTVKFNTDGVFQWGKLFNKDDFDFANDIKVDGSGNILIVGGSVVGSSNFALTLKYNFNGDTLWTRNLNNTQNYVVGNKMALDVSGNIYITGDAGIPGRCLIWKYSSFGNLDWVTSFTADSIRTNGGTGIALDNFGNIYVAGTQILPPFSNVYDYLLKVSIAGTISWSRIFSKYSNGGYMAGPVVSSDGNSIYYITEAENGTGGGGYSIATLKYNSVGDSQWVKFYNGGGIPGTANRTGNIKLDKNDNVYICGSGFFTTTGDDYVTIKYIPAGGQQWVVIYSGIINAGDGANDLFIDTSQSVYVTGTSKKATNNGYVAATVKYNQPVGINSNSNELPTNFKLYQNYPNPFNPLTTICYQLPKTNDVKLSILNILGEEVKKLVNYKQEAGTYSIVINMENCSSGIYFYSLDAGINKDVKKMVLVK